MSIRELIHQGHDSYHALYPVKELLDLQGWNSTSETFARLINETSAKQICEIGTWKGASAIHMAKCASILTWPVEIVCVDTWLGSIEMWIDPEKRNLMNFWHGMPTIYSTFLNNVLLEQKQHIITPFPTTSSIAAKFFCHHHIKFDLIYIDASHETKDVFSDLADYENLSSVIFGDDYDWPSVRAAVDSFHNQRLREFDLEISAEKWILRRKQS